MKVCLLSDSHDHIPLLDAAVERAIGDGAEAVLHCGDLVAPSTLHRMMRHQIPTHVIHGNNAGDLFTMSRLAADPNSQVHYYGMDAGLTLGGRRIFLVHYPHYARALALTGEWDLVCCGHSHKVSDETVTNITGTTSRILNPGTIGGVGRAPATYMLIDLENLSVEVCELPKTIERPDLADAS